MTLVVGIAHHIIPNHFVRAVVYTKDIQSTRKQGVRERSINRCW
jgi:hypothetical protein